MTQRMMVPAAKPDDPSSSPGTLTWWKEGDEIPRGPVTHAATLVFSPHVR